MNRFATLNQPVEVRGVGLHSGQQITARLCPTDREGVTFTRRDLPGEPGVAARFENVTTTQHATTLVDGEASVSTIEHLLAALWARGITHCRVELDGSEVPILDGSAAPWLEILERAGRRYFVEERPILELQFPVWWEGGGANVLGLPPDENLSSTKDFRLSVATNFDHPHAGVQQFDGFVDETQFARELAPARTFTLESWLEPLRAAGLIRGGSVENAVVIGNDGPSSAPRMEHEQARHKALDAVGDLALLWGSARFRGHIIAVRAGHGAHRAWMEKCRRQDALRVVNLS
jgi:UDP-3-O-[3-hydroxymyristoyl] N-acetylglucosamine deacetylase